MLKLASGLCDLNAKQFFSSFRLEREIAHWEIFVSAFTLVIAIGLVPRFQLIDPKETTQRRKTKCTLLIDVCKCIAIAFFGVWI